jgi:hypothetical protein
MGIVYIDKCRYEIPEYKEVPVRDTGIYRPISCTDPFIQHGWFFLEYVSFLVSGLVRWFSTYTNVLNNYKVLNYYQAYYFTGLLDKEKIIYL